MSLDKPFSHGVGLANFSSPVLTWHPLVGHGLTNGHIPITPETTACGLPLNYSALMTHYAKATGLEQPDPLILCAMPWHAGPNMSQRWHAMSTLLFLLLDVLTLRPTWNNLRDRPHAIFKTPFLKCTSAPSPKNPSLLHLSSHHPQNPWGSMLHQFWNFSSPERAVLCKVQIN